MATETVYPISFWAIYDQEDLEEQVRCEQWYARKKYPPFEDWESAIRCIQEELDEFRASVERGEPDARELFGMCATALLAVQEMSKL